MRPAAIEPRRIPVAGEQIVDLLFGLDDTPIDSDEVGEQELQRVVHNLGIDEPPHAEPGDPEIFANRTPAATFLVAVALLHASPVDLGQPVAPRQVRIAHRKRGSDAHLTSPRVRCWR